MRPLNRPMFRYGGPIKEGIMDGMREPKKDGNIVGGKQSPLLAGAHPLKDAEGREHHFLPALYAGGLAALNAARVAAPLVYRGFKSARTFAPGNLGFMGRLKDLTIGSGRFRKTEVPFANVNKQTGKVVEGFKPGKDLSVLQALKDPQRLGAAIREYPFLTLSTPSLATSAVTGGGPIAIDAAKGIANFLVPGTRFDPFGPKQDDIKTTGEGEIKRGGKTTNVGEVGTGGTGDSKSDAEKKQINEARIEENKQKYYKLMGIDKMNKEATYDSLIDASKIIAEKGGDLKGAIKSGDLQSSLISAISKNLDKSTDLKKQIDAAVLKAEIQKDINLTKPSAFAEQVAYLRNNPNDPLARKLSGLTSVADNLAAVKTAELTSDLVQRLVESKGTDVAGTVQDDKYQKWEKNNEGKDEIDYIQENLKGIEPGVYIINKRAIQIKDGVATEIDLDSIVG